MVEERSDRIVATNSEVRGTGRVSSVMVFTSVGGIAPGPGAPAAASPPPPHPEAAAVNINTSRYSGIFMGVYSFHVVRVRPGRQGPA